MLQICDKLNDIPKIIWTYWAHGEPPDIVKLCINNWRYLNQDYIINILQYDTVKQYIPDELPENFKCLSPQRQADWIRLALLKNYGGIWLDSSIILTEPLNWIKTDGKEGFVYYNPSHTINQEFPVIECWFIAVKKHSRFIKAWFEEFDKTCRKNKNSEYSYILELKHKYKYDFDSIVANIPKDLYDYLTIYLCAQKISIVDSLKGLLKTENCFLGPYYGSKDSWRSLEFLEDFLLKKKMEFNPKMIKLINKERHFFTGIKESSCRKGSIFSEYLFKNKHIVRSYSQNDNQFYKKFSWMR